MVGTSFAFYAQNTDIGSYTELNNRYPGRQSTIAHYYKEVMVYLEKGENAENR